MIDFKIKNLINHKGRTKGFLVIYEGAENTKKEDRGNGLEDVTRYRRSKKIEEIYFDFHDEDDLKKGLDNKLKKLIKDKAKKFKKTVIDKQKYVQNIR